MRSHSVIVRLKSGIYGFLLGIALVIGDSVNAQNLLNNPGFEGPIATSSSVLTNWTVKYVYGGPDDFCIHDRSTFPNRSGIFGAHFRPVTEGIMHAYFTQYVTGLLPGTNYVVGGWTMINWQSGAIAGKISVYIETSGGLGNVSTPICTGADHAWTYYSVTNTAKGNGTIEVRLHYDKPNTTVITDNKGLNNASGCWDDISVTRQ